MMKTFETKMYIRVFQLCLLGVIIVTSSCQNPPLLGFPGKDLPSFKEDVHCIEKTINAMTDEDKKIAWRSLLPVLLSLSHQRELEFEGFDAIELRTNRPQPSLVYPRASCPHLCELQGFKSGGDGWFLPIVLRKTCFKDHPCPSESLTFYLERWINPDGGAYCVPDGFIMDDLNIPIREGFKLPEIHTDSKPLVLKIQHSHESINGLAKGYYNVRIFPRIPFVTLQGTHPLKEFAQDIINGRWLDCVDHFDSGMNSIRAMKHPRMEWGQPLVDLSEKIRSNVHGAFEASLEDIAKSLKEIGEALINGCKVKKDVYCQARLSLVNFVFDESMMAPVLLEDTITNRFHFAVAGDLQVHENIGAANRFFALLEIKQDPPYPSIPYDQWTLEQRLGKKCLSKLRAQLSDEEIYNYLIQIPQSRLQAIQDAHFVIITGDGADAATGTAPLDYLLNWFGLDPPNSPYSVEGEMSRIEQLIRRCSKPVFMIPGNHDGSTGYPGIANWPLSILSWLSWQVKCKPFAECAGFFRRVNNHVPALVRFHPFGWPFPRYDGLIDWQYILGTTNLFFTFGGCQFVCLNTFNLDRVHRAAAGGVALNTGGGIQEEDALWFRAMVEWYRESGLLEIERINGVGQGMQFAFMHHDPRGAQPNEESGCEHRFGIYEDIDTFPAIGSFGYGFFSYGTRNGIYWPLITPSLEYLYRWWIGVGYLDAREWQRETRFDNTAYGAHPLIKAIDDNLGGDIHSKAPDSLGATGIKALFFAHNNTPLEAWWLRDKQGRMLFRDPKDQPWEGKEWNCLPNCLSNFVTMNPQEPPQWARLFKTPADKNARVIRLDDVSDIFHDQRHGFTIVTVKREGNQAHSEFTTDHVSLPMTKKKLLSVE